MNMFSKLLPVIFLTIPGSLAADTCPSEKSISVCCWGIEPYYENAQTWGSICGYYPTNTSELDGGRCTINTGSFDSCYRYAGVEFGDECHCGTGYVGTPTDTNVTDCSIRCTGDEDYTCGGSWRIQLYEGPVPVEQFPPGFESAWGPCAFDSPARDFLDDQITLLSNNTPATCAWCCYNGGFTFAGVENGNECHCSTGLNGGPPIQAPNCVTPCPGNNELICGGPWGLGIWTQT